MQHEAMVTDEADSSDGRAGTNEECAWRSGLNEERPTTSDVRGGGTVTRSGGGGGAGPRIAGPVAEIYHDAADQANQGRQQAIWQLLHCSPLFACPPQVGCRSFRRLAKQFRQNGQDFNHFRVKD